jgi:hypothetical protein
MKMVGQDAPFGSRSTPWYSRHLAASVRIRLGWDTCTAVLVSTVVCISAFFLIYFYLTVHDGSFPCIYDPAKHYFRDGWLICIRVGQWGHDDRLWMLGNCSLLCAAREKKVTTDDGTRDFG